MYLMVFLNLFNTYGALNLLKTEKWEKMCTYLPIDYAHMFIFAPSNKTRFFQNLIYKINTKKHINITSNIEIKFIWNTIMNNIYLRKKKASSQYL